jgi:hypothetical protein
VGLRVLIIGEMEFEAKNKRALIPKSTAFFKPAPYNPLVN